MFDGADVVVAEDLREDPLHHAPVGEHVADAGGDAEIVFEDDELAVFEADEVGAAHRDVDVARDLETDHLAAEVLAGVDDFARNDAVGEDAAFVVDVFQEEVERHDALGEAALDLIPFCLGDDAGEQVVGEDLFFAFVAAVDGEGDALIEEAEVRCLLAALKFAFGKVGEVVEQRLVVLVKLGGIGVGRFFRAQEHLVVRVVEQIVLHGDLLGEFRLGGVH